MKKLIIILFVAIAFVSCQKEEPVVEKPVYNAETERMWKALDGSYTGKFYVMQSDFVWKTETITFTPASEPFKKAGCDIFGTATIFTKYGSFENTENYYYSFTQHNSKRTITFYKTTSMFSSYEYNIADVTESSFRMWDYGLTEEENTITYYKD